MDKEDLEKLWTLLKDNTSPPNDMKERINYRFVKFKLFTYFLKFNENNLKSYFYIGDFEIILRLINKFMNFQVKIY